MDFGEGLYWIPLSTLALSHIPNEKTGNATSIFSLFTQLGASFGVAFSATMLSRRSQVNHRFLTEHITPTRIDFQEAFYSLKYWLSQMGMGSASSGQGALEAIYGELQRQALMLSFKDLFGYIFLLYFIVLPLVLLLKRYSQAELAEIR
jgi:DHA2 family multidrug resistance protein